MQKLHVNNICQDKFSSKHEKTKPSGSADVPKAQASGARAAGLPGGARRCRAGSALTLSPAPRARGAEPRGAPTPRRRWTRS
jgi:hypothetical protein